MKFKLNAQLERDSAFVCELALSQVRIMLDANYPWFLLIPQVNDLTELCDLDDEKFHLVHTESKRLSLCLQQCFEGEKLNVAALGNVVPQLHIHHIVRSSNDPCWPRPVWGAVESLAYPPSVLANRIEVVTRKLLD